MVNYGDLQFAERIMVARRSEMSAEWKVRFAICIASVAIQAFTKLLFSFSDVLKTTNCTFQEVDNIFCLAVGIAVYDLRAYIANNIIPKGLHIKLTPQSTGWK